jgi:hypothetical protein
MAFSAADRVITIAWAFAACDATIVLGIPRKVNLLSRLYALMRRAMAILSPCRTADEEMLWRPEGGSGGSRTERQAGGDAVISSTPPRWKTPEPRHRLCCQ